ncbi:hypothetical protein ACFJIY_19030 [Pimelobacter simplex]|uniref:hypothetical protein n=1 Tax=Nocardioides simplex TaxID=2045 RepID=UPI00366F762A
MHRTTLTATLAGLAATAALALTGCSSSAPEPAGSSAPATASETPSPVVMTSFPDLPAPTGEPDLPGLADAAPTGTGTVGHVPGPFDDRFRLGKVTFDGERVTGSLDITSDVSDLLELQVLAGFYDAGGRLLGTARFTHHLDESTHHDDGPPSEHETFTIKVPRKLAGKAVRASVGVPVLVNE